MKTNEEFKLPRMVGKQDDTRAHQYRRRQGSTRGFARASGLVQSNIRNASQSRGFAVARLLTHWSEIIGPDIAAMAIPAKVSYGREGMGATLVLLTKGATAPLVEMQKDTIRSRVNACYGYNAISRIKVTQTAPNGFAEGQIAFSTPAVERQMPDEASRDAAKTVTTQVTDDGLRSALERLGANVISKSKSK